MSYRACIREQLIIGKIRKCSARARYRELGGMNLRESGLIPVIFPLKLDAGPEYDGQPHNLNNPSSGLCR